MKIELDPTEVKSAVRAHALATVTAGRTVKNVTVHTAGGATVTFDEPTPATPTVEEAKTKAKAASK